MLKLALLPLLCGCVLLVDAPSSAQQPTPDCKEPQTQTDMTICAGQDLADADKALNAQYQATRKLLKKRDAEASMPDLKGGDEALVKAQRAWIGYRDAQCLSWGFQARGGSMEPMLVSSCEADLTRKRTAELKALVDTMM
ncbi:lysozyme inhibitor LprI family protein [Aliirhizobium smilacinae]|uniref:Lysozyme inhibitor LprI family protein n=1 Tax=Aliirhizobium smilacinae TaxID=1395944 RepID=A0A5C4XHF7_9HYPH|nr:lysozyme inhibitor LprI family protein [Rhizobium smilacinae]TNM62792.1 lysozyme inhibitor LprI family protein [Rhizobium smilacinae]